MAAMVDRDTHRPAARTVILATINRLIRS